MTTQADQPLLPYKRYNLSAGSLDPILGTTPVGDWKTLHVHADNVALSCPTLTVDVRWMLPIVDANQPPAMVLQQVFTFPISTPTFGFVQTLNIPVVSPYVQIFIGGSAVGSGSAHVSVTLSNRTNLPYTPYGQNTPILSGNGTSIAPGATATVAANGLYYGEVHFWSVTIVGGPGQRAIFDIFEVGANGIVSPTRLEQFDSLDASASGTMRATFSTATKALSMDVRAIGAGPNVTVFFTVSPGLPVMC